MRLKKFKEQYIREIVRDEMKLIRWRKWYYRVVEEEIKEVTYKGNKYKIESSNYCVGTFFIHLKYHDHMITLSLERNVPRDDIDG